MREHRGVFWMSEGFGHCCLHVNPRSTNKEKRVRWLLLSRLSAGSRDSQTLLYRSYGDESDRPTGTTLAGNPCAPCGHWHLYGAAERVDRRAYLAAAGSGRG